MPDLHPVGYHIAIEKLVGHHSTIRPAPTICMKQSNPFDILFFSFAKIHYCIPI